MSVTPTTATPSVDVSVLVLAKNEEGNLPRCLTALSWSGDLVVIDDESTDRTAEVARALGARVFSRRFDSFACQRNWALDAVQWHNEWVLHIDADEVVTPALVAEIRRAIVDPRFDAYRVPSELMFMGRSLRRATAYPVFQVRLGRRASLRFRQVGHGQREHMDPSRIGTLREPYLHFSFSKGLEEWFDKHNRYSTAEARQRILSAEPLLLHQLFARDPVERRRMLKRIAAHLPFRPTLRFLWAYVLRGGLLDGRPGFEYCRLMATYEAMIAAKIAVERLRAV